MCGIVGYIGKRKAVPILVEGLKRLEYRGYDSAGLAVIQNTKSSSDILCVKATGKVSNLENKINGKDIVGTVGIAHTRWATHGKPCDKNSHPHSDCNKNILLVHNGIVENYQELKNDLIKKGHKFSSETDTEVIAHLIEEFNKKPASTRGNDRSSTRGGIDFKNSVLETLKMLRGTYGLAIINKKEPNKIIVARLGSPLAIGIGDG